MEVNYIKIKTRLFQILQLKIVPNIKVKNCSKHYKFDVLKILYNKRKLWVRLLMRGSVEIWWVKNERGVRNEKWKKGRGV